MSAYNVQGLVAAEVDFVAYSEIVLADGLCKTSKPQ